MAMQKVLDDAVSAQDAPFLVGMTGNAQGVTCLGHREMQHLACRQRQTLFFVYFQ